MENIKATFEQSAITAEEFLQKVIDFKCSHQEQIDAAKQFTKTTIKALLYIAVVSVMLVVQLVVLAFTFCSDFIRNQNFSKVNAAVLVYRSEVEAKYSVVCLETKTMFEKLQAYWASLVEQAKLNIALKNAPKPVLTEEQEDMARNVADIYFNTMFEEVRNLNKK